MANKAVEVELGNTVIFVGEKNFSQNLFSRNLPSSSSTKVRESV